MSRCFDVTCDYQEFSFPSSPFPSHDPIIPLEGSNWSSIRAVYGHSFITGDRHQLTYNLSENLWHFLTLLVLVTNLWRVDFAPLRTITRDLSILRSDQSTLLPHQQWIPTQLPLMKIEEMEERVVLESMRTSPSDPSPMDMDTDQTMRWQSDPSPVEEPSSTPHFTIILLIIITLPKNLASSSWDFVDRENLPFKKLSSTKCLPMKPSS